MYDHSRIQLLSLTGCLKFEHSLNLTSEPCSELCLPADFDLRIFLGVHVVLLGVFTAGDLMSIWILIRKSILGLDLRGFHLNTL
jgi:hypothetical protein